MNIMSEEKPPFETSPLTRRIRDAVDRHAPFSGKIHISVADEAKWEKSKSGDEVLVRWACWNLEDGSNEVTSSCPESLRNDVPPMARMPLLSHFFGAVGDDGLGSMLGDGRSSPRPSIEASPFMAASPPLFSSTASAGFVSATFHDFFSSHGSGVNN